MSSVKISIFTPTYNRAFCIHRVFESLQQQTFKNFEWIVVDDGSTDNTKELIKGFKETSNFKIIYFKQKNQGKHVAINKGTSLASGELFSIIDSDDYVTKNYVETVLFYFNKIKDNATIAGITIPRGNQSKVGILPNDALICNLFDLYKYNISGECDMIIRTNIMRDFPFPQFSGENFCPESLIWKRMSTKYNFYFVNKTIQIGEYQKDGLSSAYWENMKKSPKAAMLYFSEISNYKRIPLKTRLYTLENYWKFSSVNTSLSFFEKLKKVPFFLSLFVWVKIKIKV